MKPELILLDEPLAGLNLEEVEDMARFIIDINEDKRWNITCVLVEHDMGVVMDLSDRVMALNFGVKIADGTPAVFDPAAYYGDRECDLAMTELFGGFPESFYAAYRATWPPDPGYAMRRDLYNLYHILNHANLFGGGYATQAEQMMQRLLNEHG